MSTTFPKIDAESLVRVRERAEAFHTRLIASGRLLATYECDECGRKVQTLQPSAEDVGSKGFWDSLKTCIYCGAISFVRVWPNGQTDLVKL